MKAAKQQKGKKPELIKLEDNCYCSQFTPHPADWEQPGADLDCTWYFSYRFYDPAMRNVAPYYGERQVTLKGMGRCYTLQDKRAAMTRLLKIEREEIIAKGWNPIREMYMKEQLEEETDYEVHPSTPLQQALLKAVELYKCAPGTRKDLRSVVKYANEAAVIARVAHKPVGEIERRHVLKILAQLAILKGEAWTPNAHNYYRAYLKMAFKCLRKYEAIKVNPIDDLVEKEKGGKMEKRQILTPEQCDEIDKFAREWDLRWWMLIHVFANSGSRNTELLRVQGKHVDLAGQSVRYWVKKGQEYLWEERPIKDVVLPLWKAAMAGCGKEDYVFSEGLQPGAKMIRPEQLTRRWKRHVKDKLGIECDWYALKHLNTTRTSELVGSRLAALQNAESEAMINKHYDVTKEERESAVLRKVPNTFAPLSNIPIINVETGKGAESRR